jgi:hypothetical protein
MKMQNVLSEKIFYFRNLKKNNYYYKYMFTFVADLAILCC